LVGRGIAGKEVSHITGEVAGRVYLMDRWGIHEYRTIARIKPCKTICPDGTKAHTCGTVDKRYVRMYDVCKVVSGGYADL
jgi:hypothetical protein